MANRFGMETAASDRQAYTKFRVMRLASLTVMSFAHAKRYDMLLPYLTSNATKSLITTSESEYHNYTKCIITFAVRQNHSFLLIPRD